MASAAFTVAVHARDSRHVYRIDEARLEARLAAQAKCLERMIVRGIPEGLRRSIPPEDVLQEVWSTAYRDFSQVTLVGPDALDRWITTIANRRLIDAIRRARRLKRGGAVRIVEEHDALESSCVSLFERLSGRGRTPSRDSSARESSRAVRAALASLPDEWQRAVRLRHFEGRTEAEIARAMGKSRAAVRRLIEDGLNQLRTRLGPATDFFSDVGSTDSTTDHPGGRERPEA